MNDATHIQGLNFVKLPTEKGTIDGYDYIIKSSWVCTCAYIKIPKGHPWFNKKAENASQGPDIPVNWGCTFYKYNKKPNEIWDKGCYVGWDYGHIDNVDAELEREQVIEDIKRVIKKAIKEAKNEKKSI